MLKRGDDDLEPAEHLDYCLFGKVTELWNLKKRMRHFMDLRKHMWGELFEPLSCSEIEGNKVVPKVNEIYLRADLMVCFYCNLVQGC